MPPGVSAPASKYHELLFMLIPENDMARDVVLDPYNAEHIVYRNGRACIGCYLDRPSKYEGRLLSFGRNSVNDVILPGLPPTNNQPDGGSSSRNSLRRASPRGDDSGNKAGGRGNYQNYRNEHFFFFLAPTGELILRDLTQLWTQIYPENCSRDEAKLYGLRGTPRQRFKWARDYQNDGNIGDRSAQDLLESKALAIAVTGMTLTLPESSLRPNSEQQSRALRSMYAPSSGPSLPGCRTRRIHKYKDLGQGSFGTVSKAVDLADGSLWAVKEIRAEKKSDSWKASFVREVETLQSLRRHDHIVHLETYQGFTIGGEYQLFFKLYEGTLSDVLRDNRHSCGLPPPEMSAPGMWERLITQMCSAVNHLHKEGVIHCDIKPDNIMCERSPVDEGYDFFLGDFGLSIPEAKIGTKPGGGTRYYNAPEVAATGIPSTASDIWALGITFGFVRGYWCYSESGRSQNFWARMMDAFGLLGGTYADPAVRDIRDAWPHRVAAISVSQVLPPAISRMLRYNPSERPTASQLMSIPIRDFIPPPSLTPAAQAANNNSKAAAMDSRTAPPPYPGTPPRQLPRLSTGMAGSQPGMQDGQILPPPVPMSGLRAHPNTRAQAQQGPQPAARLLVEPQSGGPQPPRPNRQTQPPQQRQQQQQQQQQQPQPRPKSHWERDPHRPLLPVADTMGRPQPPSLHDPLAQARSRQSSNNSVPQSLLIEWGPPTFGNSPNRGPPSNNSVPKSLLVECPPQHQSSSSSNNSVPSSFMRLHSAPRPPHTQQGHEQPHPPFLNPAAAHAAPHHQSPGSNGVPQSSQRGQPAPRPPRTGQGHDRLPGNPHPQSQAGSHLWSNNSVPRSLMVEEQSSSSPWPQARQDQEQQQQQSLPPMFSYQGSGAGGMGRGAFNGQSI